MKIPLRNYNYKDSYKNMNQIEINAWKINNKRCQNMKLKHLMFFIINIC